MDEFELKSLGRDLKPHEMAELKKIVQAEEDEWKKLKPGMHYFDTNSYLDCFNHEITAIDVENRIIYAKDYSQNGLEVETTVRPEYVANTLEELLEIYSS